MTELFDRKLLQLNRKRHAKKFSQHNFLHHEVALRMVENLELFNVFTRELRILEIGTRDGFLAQKIKEISPQQIEILTSESHVDSNISVVCDEEFLPFKTNSFDLIVSNLNLHFVNEIPQFLLKVKDLLKPDGIFIASFFGEENLSELSKILHESEQEIYQRISPRMPPTIDVKSAARLLAKAGFVNPISDFEKIELEYPNALSFLKELQAMAQGNVLVKRSRQFLAKKLLAKISSRLEESPNGKVLATFEIVTICGKK